MNLFKKIPKLPLALLAVSSLLFIVPLTAQAARLDTHTGIVKADGQNQMAYKDVNCTQPLNHYICPGDWYNATVEANSTRYAEYPITIPITVGGTDYGKATTYHYFNGVNFVANGDGSTGVFNYNWNQNQWYNGLPSTITYTDYTDNGDTGNGAQVYVSNNVGCGIVNGSNNNNQLLCNGTNVMYADYVSAPCYFAPGDYTDADWHWTRASQAWSTDGLIQGVNTVYFAGTDASANFTLGQAQFLYDTVAPECTSVQIKNITGSGYDVYIYGVDDNAPGSGSQTSGVSTIYCPTWSNNNQSDLRWDTATDIGGGTWCYHVDKSNYNNDTTGYCTDVYIYDNAGNYSEYGGCRNQPLITSPTITAINDTYITNTDVISAINVNNVNPIDYTPDSGCTVTLDIPGVTHQVKSFVMPANSSEPVWFEWHTPSNWCTVNATYTVTTPSGSLPYILNYPIDLLNENTPPDPQANDKPSPYFQYENVPNLNPLPSLSWSEYTATGSPGNWTLNKNNYTATLNSTLKVVPDKNDSSYTYNGSMYTMKSGYGINESLSASVSCQNQAAVTPAQTVVGYYPEFEYNDTSFTNGGFDRVFEMLTDDGINTAFDLAINPYSQRSSHVHFTPIWYADNTKYSPTVFVSNAWTPVGELSSQSSDTIMIDGNVFQDYFVGPMNPYVNWGTQVPLPWH